MRLSIKNKIVAVFISTSIFMGIAILVTLNMGARLERAFIIIFIIGFGIAIFEEFYVQRPVGKWLRSMHPIKSLIIYALFILTYVLIMIYSSRLLLDIFFPAKLIVESARFQPNTLIVLPAFFIISIIAILILRVIGYLGISNLLKLMVGKYHRPVLENRIFLFLDIKGSTKMVEKLGPIEARALIGKFFFDISTPITDYGGEIYRFTGDGVVAVWDWSDGLFENQIITAIDGIKAVVDQESSYYLKHFNQIPEYRLGIHGGDIVTSEEGDTKRAIGYYGETIHIAARLEQMAKTLCVSSVISGVIVENLNNIDERLEIIGEKTVRGISMPISLYELKAKI